METEGEVGCPHSRAQDGDQPRRRRWRPQENGDVFQRRNDEDLRRNQVGREECHQSIKDDLQQAGRQDQERRLRPKWNRTRYRVG